jgi:outer membrane protein OmpA-like peptidoglycan-associated protein
LFALPKAVYSQAPIGEFREIRVLPSLDTSVRVRKNGTWWIGAMLGGTGNYYLGTLNVPRLGPDPKYGTVEITSGDGSGIYAGVLLQFQPPGERFGGGLRLSLADRRVSYGSTVTLSGASQNPNQIDSTLNYLSKAVNNYIVISPEIRFNLPVDGLHLLGGLDLELLVSSHASSGRNFNNVGNITHLQTDTNYKANPIRFGGHLGVGLDIFSASLSSGLRFRLCPYITLNSGTVVTSSLNSSWNTIFARFGMDFKFGFDEMKEIILPFDPTYVEPPHSLASIQWERGIYVPGLQRAERLAVADLSLGAVEAPPVEVVTEVTLPPADEVKPIITPTISSEETVKPVLTEKKTPKISPGKMERFYFSTSTSLSLAPNAEEYLDGLADYLKANPKATVDIVGHTDNQGTEVELQKISMDRALQVRTYLQKKGIPLRRLFASGKSSFSAIAENRTEAGRKRNRRVEIVVNP